MVTRALEILKIVPDTCVEVSVVSSPVSAGFPSPADGHEEPTIEMNKRLVSNPNATFVVRVTGTSMINAGIHPGDNLIVDRSKEPVEGSVIIAEINGDFTLKRYSTKRGYPELLAENDEFPPIRFTEGDEAIVWGVVTYAIKEL